MVKLNKQPRSAQGTKRCSVSVNGSAIGSANGSISNMDNTFCVVLHVVEAINFYGREMREGEREQIIMNAALNTVDFEVEGSPSVTSETIVFNSNCIWECDMAGIKRIKTDHRPVKVTFYTVNNNAERKTIGSLLLPIRGLPVLGIGGNNSPLQLKMFWHKLICISNEFRSHKPEVLLMLAIIKKSLLHTNDFKHLMAFGGLEKQSRSPPLKSPGHSVTANMLQSQANVYVQSLVQLGLLQVGNDPLLDCDIIEVVLQLKLLKNLNRFLKSVYHGKEVDSVLLMFDFVGNVTNIELKLNNSDTYTLNDVLGLRFKSSLSSIRLYFQRIFYLPINMYINGTSIAHYRMDFGKLLPLDSYFADSNRYVCSGSFAFERFGRMGSARDLKPILDYSFTVDIQEVYRRRQSKEVDQQSQLDLNSTNSSAVIIEPPKERLSEKVEWNQNADNECAGDRASVASLNVGAELSESDDRETASESALSNALDSDDPAAGCKSKVRQKKFTRLLVQNTGHEGAEDECENSQYSRKLIPGNPLPKDEGIPHQLEGDLSDDIESETELVAIYNNRKFSQSDENAARCAKEFLQRRVEEPANILNKLLNSARDKRLTASVAKKKQCNSARTENADSMNGKPVAHEMHSKEISNHNALGKHGKTLSLEKLQIDRKTMKTSKNDVKTSVNYFESEVTLQQTVKESRLKWVVEEQIPQETEQVRLTRALKTRTMSQSSECVDLNTNRTESVLNYPKEKPVKNSIKKNMVTDDLSQDKLNMSRKINAPGAEDLMQVTGLPISPRKSQKQSKKVTQNIHLISEDSFNEADNQKSNLCKRSKRRVNDSSLEFDSQISEEQVPFVDKRYTQKQRLKPSTNAEVGECDTISTKQQVPSRTSVSKPDVSLNARWVAVNKEQTKVLEETENFITKTCNVEEETEPNDSIASPKKIVTRKAQNSYPQYIEETQSSHVEQSVDSSFVEEHKAQRKIIKKKIMPCDVQEDQETRDKNDKKLFKSKVLVTKEPINSEHMERIESNLIHSPKPKLVRNKKNGSAEETELIQSFGDGSHVDPSMQPLTRSSARRRDTAEPKYVETSEVDDLLPKKIKPMKKKSTKSPVLPHMSEDNMPIQQTKPIEKKSMKTAQSDSSQDGFNKSSESSEPRDKGSSEFKQTKQIRRKLMKTGLPNSSQDGLNQYATPVEADSLNIREIETGELKNLFLQQTKQIRKKSIKAVATNLAESAPVIAPRSDIRNCIDVPKTKTGDQIPRLGVTVHTFDQEESTASEAPCSAEKTLNMNAINMNENLKQLLAAGAQLPDDMQRKTLVYMYRLCQRKLGIDIAQEPLDKQVQCNVTEQCCTNTDYQEKFKELEHHIEKLEGHLHEFETRTHKMQEQNTRLADEKLQLKKRISYMEEQIALLQGGKGMELQQMLKEMRVQNERYLDLSKAKDRYKKQWRRCAKHVHNLKLAMYESNVQQVYQNLPEKILNLKSVLTQDADEFEREFGQFRKSDDVLSFSASGSPSDFLIKDYLSGIPDQTTSNHNPASHTDST